MLDPSIPLSVKPIALPDPVEVFSAIEQVKGQREAAELRRLAADEARRKAKQQAQLAQAYRQSITKDPTTGRPTVDFGKMMTLVPDDALPDILEALHSEEAKQLDVETKTLALNAARDKALGNAGQAVVAGNGAPSLWQSRLQALRRLKAIDEPAYQLYSQITDPQEILSAAQSWVQNAGGEAVKPQLVERVNAQGQTEKVWVLPKVGESYVQPPSTTSAGYRWAIPPGGKTPQLMSADEIRTTGATAPPPNVMPSYQWATPPGAPAPALMTPEEIRGAGATSPTAGAVKPPTGVEHRSLGFFTRLEQSDKDLEAVEEQIAKLGLLGQTRLAVAPNALQSPEGQLYDQAKRAFLTAVLRKDSGATITSAEMDAGDKTYFVQPGDNPETIAQKRRARASLAASMATESGNALQEFYGDQAPDILAKYKARAARPGADGTAPPTAPKVGDIVTVRGKKIRVTQLLSNGKFAGVEVP